MRDTEGEAEKEGKEVQRNTLWSWPQSYKKTHGKSLEHRENVSGTIGRENLGISWNSPSESLLRTGVRRIDQLDLQYCPPLITQSSPLQAAAGLLSKAAGPRIQPGQTWVLELPRLHNHQNPRPRTGLLEATRKPAPAPWDAEAAGGFGR